LILMDNGSCDELRAWLSKCPRGHLLILIPTPLLVSISSLGLNAREGIY